MLKNINAVLVFDVRGQSNNMWHSRAVFLNWWAAAHLCAVSFFWVCRQIFSPVTLTHFFNYLIFFFWFCLLMTHYGYKYDYTHNTFLKSHVLIIFVSWQFSKPSNLVQKQKFLGENFKIFLVFGVPQKFFWWKVWRQPKKVENHC